MNDNTEVRKIILAGTLCIVLFLFIYPDTTAQPKIAPQESQVASNFFKGINLDAKAAYVYDMSTGQVLFAKNENTALPLASITKIMTAITAADLAPAGTIVTVNEESLKEDGDSGLLGNEKWTLKNLLTYTLVVSSNDGAAAVAMALGSHDVAAAPLTNEHDFISSMNAKAQSIGLTDTHFLNESGLDLSTSQGGAYGSAKDVAKLFEYAVIHYPGLIAPTRYSSIKVSSVSNFTHTGENTDIIANKIPSLIASKTGYSDLAGGNLAVVFDAGIEHPIAVVVLGSGYDTRFSDVNKLVSATIQTTATSL